MSSNKFFTMQTLNVTGADHVRSVGYLVSLFLELNLVLLPSNNSQFQNLQDKLSRVKNSMKITVDKNIAKPEVYFSDGRRRIDYVIVCNKDQFQSNQISVFIKNLIDEGVEIEVDKGMMHTELTFLKLHAPEDVINHFANVYEIDFHCNYNERYKPQPHFFWKYMMNDSLRKKPEGKLYERLP